ncbi:MAG: acyl carrier protein [Planctomycetaceae bacterium]
MQDQSSGESRPPQATPSVTEIEDWLVEMIAGELGMSPDRIQSDRPILSYGVDSMQVVTIVAGLEDWLGFRFQSNPLEDHPTVESLSRFAANQRTKS